MKSRAAFLQQQRRVLLVVVSGDDAYPTTATASATTKRAGMRLHASSSPPTPDNNDDSDNDDNDNDNDDKDKNSIPDNDSTFQSPPPASSNAPPYIHDYSTEEILLCLHLEVLSESGVSLSDALEQVQAYTQSFPFAAVLPVQPLSYLPITKATATAPATAPATGGGVEIKFLRKKTDEKSGTEGGLCFFIDTLGAVKEAAAAAATAAADEAEADKDMDMDNDDKNSRMIVLTVKRNSAGQTIRKIIAERLVITSYVASLTAGSGNGDSDSDGDSDGAPALPLSPPGATVITGSRPSPVAENVVRVTSLFHKWM
jgi:hypothetical protein